MQFHLNGFQPGDPSISEAARERRMHMASTSPLEEVDVLIVGCGPTVLTLAAQLAAFPSIRTRIVEQKSGPLQIGQADGIACRTMEMFEAFGFCEPGEGPDFVLDGNIGMGGRYPTTTDGGLMSFSHGGGVVQLPVRQLGGDAVGALDHGVH